MSEPKEHPLNELMSETMEKIHQMIDTDLIVGKPINAGGATVVPISKVTFGFASGGSDFGKKKPDNDGLKFGGGGGAGVSVTPVVFLVVKASGEVSVINVDSSPKDTADRIIELVPQMVDKVEDMIKNKKNKAAE